LYNTMKTTARAYVREQAKWVLLGLAGVPLFFAVAGVQIFNNLDRFLAGSFFPFAIWAGLGALQVAMVLAIYRYRLDDVDRIIRSTVAYALTFLFCAGLYQTLIVLLGGAASRSLGLDADEVFNVAALVAMGVFYPISRTIASVVESSVARDKFDVAEKMRALRQRYGEIVDPAELYRATLSGMLNAVRSEAGAVFVWSEKSLSYKPAAAEKLPPTIEVNSNSPLIPLLRGKQLYARSETLIEEETPDAELRRLGAEIALPLISKGDLLGFVVLGVREGGHIYSNQDIEALGDAAQELSIRLEQVKSYRQQGAEIERLEAVVVDKEAELANAQARLTQIQRAFSFDLLEVLVLADAAALGAPARDFLGEHFEADLETELPRQLAKRYVAVVVVLSFADSPILQDLRRLKRLVPDAPIIGLIGEGKRAEIAYGKHPEIDLVLEGKENIPEVVYRLYRVRHSAPIGKAEVILFKHKSLADIVKAVQERAGPSLQPVLLTGEQGVGKTTVAKLVHQWSGERAFGPFVRVELRKCDPKQLPAMLFGLDGAPGKFAEAQGGTIFLDDIDCLPYTVQTQLLEILTTKELPPEAGMPGHQLDVRIVSSTPGTMERERHEGRFREDLYYKLSVERFDIAPIRERREDIKLLISAFLDNFNRQNRTNVLMPKISQMVLFENYRWPGNVTEMERRIYRAAGFLGAGESLVFEDRRALEHEGLGDEVIPLAEALRRTSQTAVQQAIAIAKGNMATAASMLQITPQELDKTFRELRATK
ncbi:MAG: sigma 54-interacting transcriptional regulator, partial [Candidatus Methylomirabilis sp.]|nr:sigma 54-interacting transcriptional regulator [Deltaproteobacteria bacterium]